MVHPTAELGDLAANEALGVRMVGGSDGGRANTVERSVLDDDLQGTRIRTIHGAGGLDGAGRRRHGLGT
jgi:hypothetical protein